MDSNRLNFWYTGSRLTRVSLDADTHPQYRFWTFEYDPNNALQLTRIKYPYCDPNECYDPLDPNTCDCNFPVPRTQLAFAYDPNSSRIASILPRDAHAAPNADWVYTYMHGKLATVTTPSVAEDLNSPYVESFAFDPNAVNALCTSTLTDRRGYIWRYRFDGFGNLQEVTNPLIKTRTAVYDADHNVTDYGDELDHHWTATYDDVGNLLTLSSPLTGSQAQTWTVGWEQPDPTARPNFWRATQVTDPNGNWVQYGYSNDPQPRPDAGDNGYGAAGGALRRLRPRGDTHHVLRNGLERPGQRPREAQHGHRRQRREDQVPVRQVRLLQDDG